MAHFFWCRYDKFNNYREKYLIKLAESHHNLGNFFEEKKALSDLLKHDPQNATGLYRTGMMYIAQHDIKNAEEYFLRALSNDSGLLQAKYNLALLYETNNREKAKELFTEILEEDPSYEEARVSFDEFLSTSEYDY